MRKTASSKVALAGVNLSKGEFSGSLAHRTQATRFHPKRIGDYASNDAESGIHGRACSARAAGSGELERRVAPRRPLPLAQIQPPCDSTIDY